MSSLEERQKQLKEEIKKLRKKARRELRLLLPKHQSKCYWCGKTLIRVKSLKNKKKYTVLRVSGNKVYWREDIPGAVLVKECHFATVDHIIPLQWGGNSEEYNLVPSCRDCNCKRTCDRDKFQYDDTAALATALKGINGSGSIPGGVGMTDREERIAVKAYYKWEAAGRPEGLHEKFWLEAEAEIKEEEHATQMNFLTTLLKINHLQDSKAVAAGITREALAMARIPISVWRERIRNVHGVSQ